MAKIYDAGNKIYRLMEKTIRIELESMQKEASAISYAIQEASDVITQKKIKVSEVREKMQLEDDSLTLDLMLFQQRAQYLSRLQDELLNDELLAKSLKSRRDKHLNKMKIKFQEGKLYQNAIEKNDALFKQEEDISIQKIMDDLANISPMEALVDE